MNWHAVAVAAFCFIAFGAVFSLFAATEADADFDGRAGKWFAIMLLLMVIDVFLAGVVWA